MAPHTSTRKYYRKRVKGSMCRGKAPKPCRMTKGSAKRVHFCQKRTNTYRKRM